MLTVNELDQVIYEYSDKELASLKSVIAHLFGADLHQAIYKVLLESFPPTEWHIVSLDICDSTWQGSVTTESGIQSIDFTLDVNVISLTDLMDSASSSD